MIFLVKVNLHHQMPVACVCELERESVCGGWGGVSESVCAGVWVCVGGWVLWQTAATLTSRCMWCVTDVCTGHI